MIYSVIVITVRPPPLQHPYNVLTLFPSPAAEADTTRPRSMSNSATWQEKQRGMTVSRWRLTKRMGVSGSKPAFSPKPPPYQQLQGGCQTHRQSVNRQGSAGLRTNNKGRGAATATPATEAQPRKFLKVRALPLNVEQHNQPSCVQSKQDAATAIAKVAATARETKTMTEGSGGGGSGIGLRPLLTDSCSDLGHNEGLPRSGSAPSSSAMTLSNPSGTTCLPSCQVADAGCSLLGTRSKVACPPPEPGESLAKPTRSCWDERRDETIAPGDAATPPQDVAASTGATSVMASETEQIQPVLKWSSSSNSSRKL